MAITDVDLVGVLGFYALMDEIYPEYMLYLYT